MALTKWKVTRIAGEPEEIEAADCMLKDGWFYFTDGSGIVTQIRSDDVKRVDRVR